MDDELIVQLYWDRSENAISETDRKYGAYCHSIAYGILQSKEDAKESVNDSSKADVTENGVSILPEGIAASIYADHWGDALWISLYSDNASDDEYTYLVLYPDGANEIVSLPAEYYSGGADNYLFYPSYADEYETEWSLVCCTDITTGETWALDVDIHTDDLYNLRTDGNYLYSTAPWDDGHMCWALVYDENGKPIGIKLIEEDLTE